MTDATNDDKAEARESVGAVWREHAGSVLGVLARRLADLDLAEESL